MSKREQLIERAWQRVASRLSNELDRTVSINEARQIIAERNKEEEKAENIKKQERLRKEQERLRKEQERLRKEQEIIQEQQDIQYRFGINVLEETARFRELERQKNLKEEHEKNTWKFKKPHESLRDWKARIKQHNAEQRAIYLQHQKNKR